LQHHGLTSAWRSDDETALTFADGAEEIEHAASHVVLGGFHLEASLRVEGRQVIEEDFVARDLGVFEIDRFDFDQREISFAILGRTDLTGDSVAGAEVKFADCDGRRRCRPDRGGSCIPVHGGIRIRRGDIRGRPRKDETVLFGLRAEDLEDEFLFAHAAGAGNVEFLGDFGEIGDVFSLSSARLILI